MRLTGHPADLADELNRSVEALDFEFTTGDGGSSLRVDGGRVIQLPDGAGGRFGGGAGSWMRAKHRDGRIHEPGLVATIVALTRFRPDLTFFDVGALYGYFSLMVESIGDGATAFAFEVSPDSFEAMQTLVAANAGAGRSRVHCCNVGLSDATSLQRAVSMDGIRLDEETADGSLSVDLLRLDDFVRWTGVAPDVIKIDVEGYQAKIIPGALEVLAASEPVILLELDSPEAMARFERTNRDVLAPVFDLGYEMVWTPNHRTRSCRFHPVAANEFGAEQESNSLAVLAKFDDAPATRRWWRRNG